MCIAVPGKVIEVNGKFVKVDFGGNIVEARTGLPDINTGDYALIHAGYVIQKMSKTEAEEMEDLMRFMNELPDNSSEDASEEISGNIPGEI
ncbi:MAG: HypC/HybG/HupF family hydrogenase formation chaperone [Lachnospiraceae bacterium]